MKYATSVRSVAPILAKTLEGLGGWPKADISPDGVADSDFSDKPGLGSEVWRYESAA